MSGPSLHVSFDKTHYDHGVKVWNEAESSLLDVASQRESEALVEALMAIGASHRDGIDRAQAPAVTTGEKVSHEAKKAVGIDDKHTAHHGNGMHKSPAGDHVTPVSPDGNNHIPGQHHGLGSENRKALHGNQTGYGNQPMNTQPGYSTDKTQYQAHGLPTTNNVKHEQPRGFAQVENPTMTP